MTVDPTYKYKTPAIKSIWHDLAEGYFNYGRIDPDQDTTGITLKQANDDMVDYIIKKLDITQDSFVLDAACGMGMYTVQIAKRTGCRFIGTDINMAYLEQGRATAAKFGVAEQGQFLFYKFGEIPEDVKKERYTHVLCLSAMLYAHPILDTVLQELADCCTDTAKLLIWDYMRVAAWSDCQLMNKHLKMPHPLLAKQEFLVAVERSPLQLTEVEDTTRYIIPGYDVLSEECKRRDPGMEVLTFPLMRDAFKEGKIAYIIYYCKLK